MKNPIFRLLTIVLLDEHVVVVLQLPDLLSRVVVGGGGATVVVDGQRPVGKVLESSV